MHLQFTEEKYSPKMNEFWMICKRTVKILLKSESQRPRPHARVIYRQVARLACELRGGSRILERGWDPTLEESEMSRRSRWGDAESVAKEECERGGVWGASPRKFSKFGCFFLQSRHSSALFPGLLTQDFSDWIQIKRPPLLVTSGYETTFYQGTSKLA